MVSVKSFAAAAAAAVVSTAAYAADMPMPPPQMVYQQAPPCCETGRWYLRGDIGIGMQTFSSFDLTQTNSAFVWPASWQIVQKSIQDTSIFGFGVGYEFNNWLRFDVTGEYRTKAMFKATGSYTDFSAPAAYLLRRQFRQLFGRRVHGQRLYRSRHLVVHHAVYRRAASAAPTAPSAAIQDNGIISNGSVGFGYGSDNSAWTLAWNVQAGLTYNINDNLKIDFSWRYLNLGSPQTAVVACQNTPSCPGAFYTLHDFTSQDFRIGLRWLFPAGGGIGLFPVAQAAFAPQQQYIPAPPPQYVPQPQYAPPPMAPPVYAPQPPISTRG